MKTIVINETNVSIYYLEDDHEVLINKEGLWLGSGDHINQIVNFTSETATIHTDVPTVSDWYGNKYLYNGSAWSANPDYKGLSMLTADINNSVTTIPVFNSKAFPSSGGTLLLEDEKITYTGIDGNNLTGCTRGAASTDAASHSQHTDLFQI